VVCAIIYSIPCSRAHDLRAKQKLWGYHTVGLLNIMVCKQWPLQSITKQSNGASSLGIGVIGTQSYTITFHFWHWWHDSHTFLCTLHFLIALSRQHWQKVFKRHLHCRVIFLGKCS